MNRVMVIDLHRDMDKNINMAVDKVVDSGWMDKRVEPVAMYKLDFVVEV